MYYLFTHMVRYFDTHGGLYMGLLCIIYIHIWCDILTRMGGCTWDCNVLFIYTYGAMFLHAGVVHWSVMYYTGAETCGFILATTYNIIHRSGLFWPCHLEKPRPQPPFCLKEKRWSIQTKALVSRNFIEIWRTPLTLQHLVHNVAGPRSTRSRIQLKHCSASNPLSMF